MQSDMNWKRTICDRMNAPTSLLGEPHRLKLGSLRSKVKDCGEEMPNVDMSPFLVADKQYQVEITRSTNTHDTGHSNTTNSNLDIRIRNGQVDIGGCWGVIGLREIADFRPKYTTHAVSIHTLIDVDDKLQRAVRDSTALINPIAYTHGDSNV